MKRKKGEEMIQSAVRLPRSLHERLQKAGGARGMGEEMRRRLEYTFAAAGTSIDETTDEVIAEIRDIADDLSRYAPWHSERLAFEVFRAAVNALLANHQPRAEQPEISSELFRAVYGDKSAEDMGLIIAQAAIFAYGRARRGGLTGLTGLTGMTTDQVGFTDERAQPQPSQAREVLLPRRPMGTAALKDVGLAGSPKNNKS